MDEKKAYELLKKYADSPSSLDAVYTHARKVSDLSVQIAKRFIEHGHYVDLKFIRIAALLHDIGRFKVPPGKESGAHGYVGGELLKSEGLDKKFVRVCETHTGISKDDLEYYAISVPGKDYLPETNEEKIIYFADKLYSGDVRIPVKEAARRFRTELGREQEERFLDIYNWIRSIIGEV